MKDLLSLKSTVLCVDDEPELLEIIASALEPHFDEIVTATNGFTAIEIMKHKHIDVVLTDFKMPKMNGIELVEEIKKLKPLLPIIMVTGNGGDSMILDSLRSGAFDILDKPFREEVLINRVKNALILPHLMEILTCVLALDPDAPSMGDLDNISMPEQLKRIYMYGQLIKMKALRKNQA
ncbi:MAG: response regulator [Bacteriovoracaceae bacterium]